MSDDWVGPLVEVDLESCEPSDAPGFWRMAWRVRNVDVKEIRVLAGWLPHGKLHADRTQYAPPTIVRMGSHVNLPFLVRCQEEAGTVVENAFVILSVEWGGESWRIFARLRVTVDAGGAPSTTTVVITAQPIGYAQAG
ncbi:MAG: hypothetical protein HW416_1358 [Chloroflexi bacterium]|nr:hypothetical protein [Chloroflexota bacterium]